MYLRALSSAISSPKQYVFFFNRSSSQKSSVAQQSQIHVGTRSDYNRSGVVGLELQGRSLPAELTPHT